MILHCIIKHLSISTRYLNSMSRLCHATISSFINHLNPLHISKDFVQLFLFSSVLLKLYLPKWCARLVRKFPSIILSMSHEQSKDFLTILNVILCSSLPFFQFSLFQYLTGQVLILDLLFKKPMLSTNQTEIDMKWKCKSRKETGICLTSKKIGQTT